VLFSRSATLGLALHALRAEKRLFCGCARKQRGPACGEWLRARGREAGRRLDLRTLNNHF